MNNAKDELMEFNHWLVKICVNNGPYDTERMNFVLKDFMTFLYDKPELKKLCKQENISFVVNIDVDGNFTRYNLIKDGETIIYLAKCFIILKDLQFKLHLISEGVTYDVSKDTVLPITD